MTVFRVLAEFRERMAEIKGMLETGLEDEMADFNSEDFKRDERNDRYGR